MASSSSMDPAWFINHVIIWNNIVPVQWIYIRKINNDPRTPTIFDAIAARWYDLNQNFPPIARFNYAVVITTVKLSPRWFTWKWQKKKREKILIHIDMRISCYKRNNPHTKLRSGCPDDCDPWPRKCKHKTTRTNTVQRTGREQSGGQTLDLN